MEAKNKPYIQIRSGGVVASAWKNKRKVDGKDVEFTNVSIEKNYKEKDSDEWKTTNSYGLNDLMRLQSVVATMIQRMSLSIETVE